MITKNFKNFLSLQLQSTTGWKGCLPIKAPGGTVYYLSVTTNSYNGAFPVTPSESANISSSYSNPGVYFGTGDSAPTENDYALQSVITSGLSSSSPIVAVGVDGNGNPYKEMLFTISNTTASDITIKEVGYVQKLYATTAQGGTSASAYPFLLDRTVLSTPVTVPAGGTAALKYTLKTIIS